MPIDQPPKDFWPQLLELDQQLHNSASSNGRIPGVKSSTVLWTDMGHSAHIVESGYRPNVTWMGRRFLGGVALQGRLYIQQPLGFEDALGQPPSTIMEKRFLYTHGRHPYGQRVGVYLHEAPEKGQPNPKAADIERAIQHGAIDPKPEDYAFLLNAMTYGANEQG